MSYTTNSLANYDDDAFVPDEREDIEGHACQALNTNSRVHGGYLLRSTKDVMPNTALMSCREPLMNESIAAAFEGFDPQDEQERRLCQLQLVASAHVLDCFTRANKEGLDPERRDAELKHAMKLMSGVIAASEALDKHRGGGNQKITVERVNVADGGQAVVGHVDARGAARQRTASQSEAAASCELTDDSAASADGEKLAEQLNVRQRQRQPVER